MEKESNYKVICKTKEYQLVLLYNTYRVENLKGLYADEVQYIEIPKKLAEWYEEILNEYKDFPKGEKREGKKDGIIHFNHLNDLDFENEYAEMYPEKYN